MHVDSLEALRRLYDLPKERTLRKELRALDAHCRRFIALSPFFVLSAILDQPNGIVAAGVSIFPWTAPVAMMLRLPSGGVPAWQLALSMGLLLVSAIVMLRLAARIFRVGLLLYGKTPNLPEILRASKRA